MWSHSYIQTGIHHYNILIPPLQNPIYQFVPMHTNELEKIYEKHMKSTKNIWNQWKDMIFKGPASRSPINAKAWTKNSMIRRLWSTDFSLNSLRTHRDSCLMKSLRLRRTSSINFTSLLIKTDSRIRRVPSSNLTNSMDFDPKSCDYVIKKSVIPSNFKGL